jgi:hypothetical protein
MSANRDSSAGSWPADPVFANSSRALRPSASALS